MLATRALVLIFLIALSTFLSRRCEAAPGDPPPVHLVFIPYDGAKLERVEYIARTGRDLSEWSSVCPSKCELDLDVEHDIAHWRYRITDSAGQESFSFRISGKPGERVVVTAHPGSPTAHGIGALTTAVGGIGLTASAVAFVVVLIQAAVACRRDPDYATGGYYPDPDCPSFAPVGIALGASAMALTVGVALLVSSNPHSSQSLDKIAKSLFVHEPIREGSSQPGFASTMREAGPALPAARTSSLFTIHF